MYVEDLIKGYIETSQGGAVADQFEDTMLHQTPFEDNSENALRLILKECRKIQKANLLSESAAEELNEYISELAAYLSKVGITQNA